jgi:hypothetical protein
VYEGACVIGGASPQCSVADIWLPLSHALRHGREGGCSRPASEKPVPEKEYMHDHL